MVFIPHSIPDSIVFIACRMGEPDHSVCTSEPIESFGIPEQGIELIPVSRTCDLRNWYKLQRTVIA